MRSWGTLVDQHGNRWRVRLVGPGLYEDDEGTLHLVLAELLKWGGYPDTEENRRMLASTAHEAIAEKWPGVRVVSE